MREAFSIDDVTIRPGARALVDLELPRLNSHTRLSMPVHVVHGRREGPCLFQQSHGDEEF